MKTLLKNTLYLRKDLFWTVCLSKEKFTTYLAKYFKHKINQYKNKKVDYRELNRKIKPIQNKPATLATSCKFKLNC